MSYKRRSAIPVVEGGSGDQALTNHNVLLGQGTSPIAFAAPTATSGVPLVSQGASADPSFDTLVVEGGGTGVTSFDAYAVVCGGTTSTDPLQDVSPIGSSGDVLTSNGGGMLPSWQAASSGASLNTTEIDNGDSPYTVLANDQFIDVDCSAGVVTVRLPNAPATGKYFIIKDKTGSAPTFNITITTVGGVVNIDAATSFVANTAYEAVSVVFDGSAYSIY